MIVFDQLAATLAEPNSITSLRQVLNDVSLGRPMLFMSHDHGDDNTHVVLLHGTPEPSIEGFGNVVVQGMARERCLLGCNVVGAAYLCADPARPLDVWAFEVWLDAHKPGVIWIHEARYDPDSLESPWFNASLARWGDAEPLMSTYGFVTCAWLVALLVTAIAGARTGL